MSTTGNPTFEKMDQLILRGVHVLVVEDTWHVAKALKTLLESLGMHVAGPAATTADARVNTTMHVTRNRLRPNRLPSHAVIGKTIALDTR